jgi:GNAT superfamily N-acetyltransferase
MVTAPVLAEISPTDTPGLYREFLALYDRAFPDAREREDPGSWPERMTDPPPPGQPRTRLLAARDGSALLGGLVFEWYPESRCGLLTYLAVRPEARRSGLGSLLVLRALEMLRHGDSGEARAVFSEVEDPDQVEPDADLAPMPPRDRLAFFRRLDARRIRFPYVQPDLGAGRARHLLLLCYGKSLPEGVLRRDVLAEFLREFYRCLGTEDPEADPDFQAMTADLPDPVPLEPLPVPAP